MSQQVRSDKKKQQSISQFFPIKSSQESPSARRLPTRPEAGSKRPPQHDELDGGSRAGQPAKRQRASSLHEREDFPVPNAGSSQSQLAAASPSPPSPPPPSSRTDRFLLRSSQDHAASQAAFEPTDDAASLRNAELHRRFVQKLGHPESLARLRDRGRALAGGETLAEDEDEAEAEAAEDGERAVSPPSKSAPGKKKGAKTKLTPMEIQVVDLKRKHSDTLLIVEVGYKFRFFGDDARIAAKELGIMCIPGKLRFDDHPSESHLDRFASASVPVHRLSVHARRLVVAGHKVGVVRQVETAALKKAGTNRNAPFVRKLTNVYTKGTYIDEAGELEPLAEGGTGSAAGGYLLCLTEELPRASGGLDEKVQIGMISVHPATGDIIYDNFEDGFMRSELETRILHISPCEFLIVGELSGGTAKLIRHLSGSNTNVFGDRSRVETVPRSAAAVTEAYSRVAQFYADKLGGRTGDAGATTDTGEDNSTAQALLDKVLKLPEVVTTCLAAMINHLTEYGLEHVFDLTKNFHSFSARTHMLVTGTTLESLEIYRNSTDYGERGSLFWAIDKTVTPFGRRQLRRWVGRPLLNHDQLETRLAAVSELHDSRASPRLDRLETLLKGIRTDLERSLIRIYYGRCSRSELVAVLQTFQRIGMHFQHVDSGAATGFASPLIADAICALPPLLGTVLPYLERVNAEGARKDDKYLFFREGEETEPMVDHQLGIAAVEQELDAHRAEAAEALSRRGTVQYVTTAGIEYLIEVANPDTRRVPASWVKISGTKKLSRFHTPTVIRLIRERDQHRESLTAACDAAFADFLRSLAAEYQPLRDAVSALATLDCLVSLAKLASLPGYSKPTILPADAPPQVSISAGRHPVAEHLLPDGYIPFSAAVSSPSPLAYLITGPNMGGKSSFVRAVALLVLLAQIGSFVPAESLSLTLADAIFTRMGARDNIFAGESTFMVELGETARILRAATARSLIVLDELGRGTSTHDGAAIAHAVLDYVVRQPKGLTLFITHYQSLARAADGLGPGLVKNVHMRFTTSTPRAHAHHTGGNLGEEEEEDITFLYELGDGVAHRSYGLNVARLAHIPRRVLDVAQRKSAELEVAMGERRLHSAACLLADLLSRPARTQLDHIVTCIEQL